MLQLATTEILCISLIYSEFNFNIFRKQILLPLKHILTKIPSVKIIADRATFLLKLSIKPPLI